MTSTFHIVIAMKPLEGNFAQNALKHGVAGINVDGCRIGTEKVNTHSRGRNTAFPKRPTEKSVEDGGRKTRQDLVDMSDRHGRWPANVILEDNEKVKGGFPETCGESKPRILRHIVGTTPSIGWSGGSQKTGNCGSMHCDSGSASRFFKQVKEE
jgi:hypothetical protein